MGLKERVMELVLACDRVGLERLAVAEPRAARHLVGRLWDDDEGRRHTVATALAASAAAHPELGVEVVRRLLWALNDEAGTNGVYGVVALGEIGARCPQLMAPFVGPLASWVWDDGLRPAVLGALARIAEGAPELVRPHLEDLRRAVGHGRAERLQLAELERRVGEEPNN